MSAASGIDRQRRTILLAALSSSGSFMIGAMLPWPAAEAAEDSRGKPSASLQPNAFIRIDPDNTITLTLPYVEMGQGAYTSQAMIVAEELEVPLSAITLRAAPADEKLYASPLFGGQITGGSGSLRGAWMTMRSAAAAARTMLVQAAAQEWQADPSECEAAAGEVVHRPSGRKRQYGALAGAAARLPVPEKPVLKQRAAFKLVGTSANRVDMPDKVRGAAKFGIDVRVPGMLYAAVAASPVFNGRLRSVDAAAAMRIGGVRKIVRLDNAVAVIADSTWKAFKGLDALQVEWEEGPNAGVDTAELVARADAALDMPGLVFANKGNADAAEAGAAHVYRATFRLPALAHAAIEPMNCTVHVRRDSCEVWVGSQAVGRAQKYAAEAAGLPLERVRIHNMLLGGGFGRRLESDYIHQAVLIGKQAGAPVKMTWSRAEDLQHDYYRGHNHSRVTVALDGQHRPVGWRHRIAGPNIMARFLPVYQKGDVDLDIVDAASGPYDIPNVLVDFTRHEAPDGMNTGNWRGVGPTRNVFIVESVIDDLAVRAGADPLAYRRSLMGQAPARLRHVLDLAAEKARWGTPLPARSGRGIAVFEAFGSFAAMVAQVHVDDAGQVRVEQLTCAIDTGLPVNPDIVRAQVEGGITFGVSAALLERITVQKGRVVQANYDGYKILRMNQAPRIEVHVVDSTEDPGGIGEVGTAGAIAAVANAVRAATGIRAFSLPLDAATFKVTT